MKFLNPLRIRANRLKNFLTIIMSELFLSSKVIKYQSNRVILV